MEANQRISAGLSVLSFSRITKEKNTNAVVPFGSAVDYTYFITPSVAFSTQFVASLGGNMKVIFMGGGGGLTWFLKGGIDRDFDDTYIKTHAVTNFHWYIHAGVTARSFDFTSIDKNVEVDTGAGTKVVVKDPQDVSQGSFIAPLFAMGLDVPVFEKIFVGSRVQVFSSLSSQSIPDISGLEFWFSAGMQF